MPIYEHHFKELLYYRVFRAWGGVEYQEYVRIKRSKEAAYAKAVIIDSRLEKRQRAFNLMKAHQLDFHIRPDGRIRGLLKTTIVRQGRKDKEVFDLRINVPWEKSIKRTVVTIDSHENEEEAFKVAIEKIADWYGFSTNSTITKSLMTTFPMYSKNETPDQKNVNTTKKEEIKQWFNALQKAN